MCCIKSGGEVVGNLAAYREYHAVRVLEFENIHYALVGEFVEVKAVADIVVGRHGLGVVVYHHRAVALFTGCEQGVDRAPVELYR